MVLFLRYRYPLPADREVRSSVTRALERYYFATYMEGKLSGDGRRDDRVACTIETSAASARKAYHSQAMIATRRTTILTKPPSTTTRLTKTPTLPLDERSEGEQC